MRVLALLGVSFDMTNLEIQLQQADGDNHWAFRCWVDMTDGLTMLQPIQKASGWS